MTANKFSRNFEIFFKRLNPSSTYAKTAARAQKEIRSLIEDREGPSGDFRIKSFIQGSYGRYTAIHTINDVDIVALCSLSYKTSANQNTRNQIFAMIASSIKCNKRYKGKVLFNDQSICIKVILKGIKLEVIPALRVPKKQFKYEPFYIFRTPEDGRNDGKWELTYARRHQELLSEKNDSTDGLFIPMVKVLKHIRFLDSQLNDRDAVSFHIECLLYALKNSIYSGSIGECIENILNSLAGFTPLKAVNSEILFPCRNRLLFREDEWSFGAYTRFHNAVLRWKGLSQKANNAVDENEAVTAWKELLGDTFFPLNPQ